MGYYKMKTLYDSSSHINMNEFATILHEKSKNQKNVKMFHLYSLITGKLNSIFRYVSVDELNKKVIVTKARIILTLGIGRMLHSEHTESSKILYNIHVFYVYVCIHNIFQIFFK